MDERLNKICWLRPSRDGTDSELIKALLEALPVTQPAPQQSLIGEPAQKVMAELFLRGYTVQDFMTECGLNGSPVDPTPVGCKKHELIGKKTPIYYRFWLVDKDASVAARAIQEILLSRQERMPAEHRSYMVLQLCIDVDTDDSEHHSPLDVGLTPHAVCLELGLDAVQDSFAEIERVCQDLSTRAYASLRVTLGSFGGHEYEGMSKLSLFSKRIPYPMGTEWILFKNIHRRAGRMAWLWQKLAVWRNRKDN